MKKRLIIIVLLFLFSFIGIFSVHFLSTMSPDDCIDYCIEHSERGATTFQAFADDRYLWRQVYWVATDGDASKPQEVFIFRLKPFLSKDLNRYQYVAGSVGSTKEEQKIPVGSMQFFSRKDDGEKESSPTLLLYGSNKESDIFYCEYTIESDDKTEIKKEKVRGKNYSSDAWIHIINNLESGTKISDIKFYDTDGNLLYKY